MQVRKLTWQSILTLIITAILLSACNLGAAPEPTLDVNAISTAAVGTVVAQFNAQLTQTALAVPPSPTPINTPLSPPPTFEIPANALTLPVQPLNTLPVQVTTPLAGFTPLATVPVSGGPTQPSSAAGCDDSVFIADITYPDGSELKSSKAFEKVWRIKNTGTCTWDDGYSLVWVTGESLSGKTWAIIEKSDFVKPGETKDIGVDMVTPNTAGDHGGCWKMKNDRDQFFGTWLCVVIKVVN